MSRSKKILFVMPRLPFPATSGRKTSLYHYCRILSEELGYKLIVAAFLEKGDDPNLKPKFIDRLEILPKPTSVTKIKNILFDSVLLKRKPMQVSLYWNPEAKKIIDTLVDEENPDVYDALARKYLNIGCSCLSPNKNRMDLLDELIDDFHVDGVVDLVLQACHTYNVETAIVKKLVKDKKGIPYTAVETDYSQADIEQINTRMAAFIEML